MLDVRLIYATYYTLYSFPTSLLLSLIDLMDGCFGFSWANLKIVNILWIDRYFFEAFTYLPSYMAFSYLWLDKNFNQIKFCVPCTKKRQILEYPRHYVLEKGSRPCQNKVCCKYFLWIVERSLYVQNRIGNGKIWM